MTAWDYREMAFRVARSYSKTATQEQVEDAVSLCLLKLCRLWDTLDHENPARVRKWVALNVKHRLIEEASRVYNRRKVCFSPQGDALDETVDRYADSGNLEEQIVGHVACRDAIRAIKARMSPMYFRILVCEMRDMTARQGASHLGLTVAAYKSRLYRAKAQAAKILGGGGIRLIRSIRQRLLIEQAPLFEYQERDDWFTPDWLFEDLSRLYGPFTLDAAASPKNAKCAEFYTVDDDGLSQPWRGRVWCNPPYKKLIRWVRKAYEETQAGNCELALLLLPAQTSTDWFHDYALPFAQLHWIRRRVRFGAHGRDPIMPSVVVIFRKPEAAPAP